MWSKEEGLKLRARSSLVLLHFTLVCASRLVPDCKTKPQRCIIALLLSISPSAPCQRSFNSQDGV
jgi:hypothetical protein